MNNIYHFTSVDVLIKILISDNFRLSNIRNVNDVDEFSFLDTSVNRFLDSARKNMFNQLKDEELEDYNNLVEFCERALNNMKHELESISDSINDDYNLFNNMAENVYIGCFTKINGEIEDIINKPTIWGHYADSHRGVCLIFDEERLSEIIAEQLVGKFYYNNDSIEYYDKETLTALRDSTVLGSDTIEEKLKKVYFAKHEDWQVEDEYRILVFDKNKELGKAYLNLRNIRNAIKGIIFGARCSEDDVEIIEKLIDIIGLNRFYSGSDVFAYKATKSNFIKVQEEFLSKYKSFNRNELNIIL